MKKIVDGAMVTLLSATLLYLFSTVKHRGFLGYFNIDPDLLEQNAYQVIYGGFTDTLIDVFKFLSILTVLCAFWVFLVYPSLKHLYKKSKCFKKILDRVEDDINSDSTRDTREDRLLKITTNLTLSLVIFVLFIVYLARIEQGGVELAKDVFNEHIAGSSSPEKMYTVLIHAQEKSLRKLSCGAHHCAGIEEGSNLIYYFPTSIPFSHPAPVRAD